MTTLRVVLIKPSKYDDEGYVITHWKGTLPSNTLAALMGLTQRVKQERLLGDGVDIQIEMWDETVHHIRPERIMRRARRAADKTLICLVGVQTNQFPRASDLARRFRALGAEVMLGGFHTSGSHAMLGMQPEMQALIDEGITLICGEVEEHWHEMLRDVLRGETKPMYDFVDDKPDLFEKPIPMMPRAYRRRFTFRHMATVDTSRGCPFNCSFCTIINVQGRKMRWRSPEKIAATVRERWAQGVTHYFFVDDNLARNRVWEEIFDRLIALREQEGIELTFMMQVDLLSHTIPNFVEKARRAGCTQVFLGMESLNPANLADSGKRQNNIDDYRVLIDTYRRHEIATHCGYIIGFDGDSYESVIHHDLERLMHEIQPDQASFFMMTPLPGSADHKRWKGEGRQMSEDFNEYDSFHAAMPHPRMTADEWTRAYQDAWRIFYSFDNMRAILSRTKDRNYFNVMKNFIWYRNAMIEGEHPMITGFFRRKRRLDRRPGFEIESRWAFFKRRTREISHLMREWLRLYWEMQELWLATWPQRDHRVQLARQYVVRWADIGRNLLRPLRWPHIPAQMSLRFGLLGRRRLLAQGQEAMALVRRRARISRRMLNLYWRRTLRRFGHLQWHRIDVGETIVNAWREMKINLWFLAHIVKSKRFDMTGEMG
ncbi:radical SAM protein [Candidatus Sumerlaeota bacterium]|nr:radical SAM protein [Candidatus Sumerlaeota bacterium]